MDGHCSVSNISDLSIEDCLQAGANRIKYLEEQLADKEAALAVAKREKEIEKGRTDQLLGFIYPSFKQLAIRRDRGGKDILNFYCPARCCECGNIGTAREMYTKKILQEKVPIEDILRHLLCRKCTTATQERGENIFSLQHTITNKLNPLSLQRKTA